MMISINKHATWQYIILYLVYMLNDSIFYKKYVMQYNIVLFALFAFLLLLRNRKSQYVWMFEVFSLLCVLFVRILVGGVGLAAWLRWAVPIIVVYYAISVDKENVLSRWVKLVYCMTIISLLFWLVCQLDTSFARRLMFSHYSMGSSIVEWTSSTSAVYRTEYGDGLFLYSIRYFEVNRNNGVFSEPGLHQMVLTGTLFLVLFARNLVRITIKEQFKYVFIFLVAIITTQSTSGYLSTILIILVYFIQRQREEKDNRNKYWLIILALIAMLGLVIDYFVRSNNSIVYSIVIKKIIKDGSIDLSADSGYWRIITIQTSIESMIKNPLGIGYDRMGDLISKGSTGAQIFVSGAALGIVPFVVFQVWALYPILKTKRFTVLEKFVFIFVYYNCMLAQSKEMYSVFILISLFFALFRSDFKNESHGALWNGKMDYSGG